MKYTELFFTQGGEAVDYIDKITHFGEYFTIEYILNNLPSEDECDFKTFDSLPWGEVDTLYTTTIDGIYYVLSYQTGIPYIGLTRIDEEVV